MSLSNRFQHPFEKWMNQMWKRENSLHRRPSAHKSMKHSPKSLAKPNWDDWTGGSLMAPFMSPKWMESYRDRWDDAFGSELMNFDPSKMMMQTETTTNDHGDHVVKARMPFGIEQDDIHLNFEDGGLRLSASKVHEEEKKQQGSKHKSYMEVSHYWPLAEDIRSEDIEAHFDSDENLLEIVIPQSKLMASRYGRGKSTPISIGGLSSSSSGKPHQMLDQAKSAAEIVSEQGSEMVGKAKDAVASGMNTLKETVKGAKSSAKSGADSLAEKGSEMAGKAKEAFEAGVDKSAEMAGKAKESMSSSAESLKDSAKGAKADAKSYAQTAKANVEKMGQDAKTGDKGTNPLDAPQVPSIDEM